MVDPYLHLGLINIRWYTVIFSLSILIPYFLSRKNAPKYSISKTDIDNLFLITVSFGLIGARVYHVIDKWFFYKNHLIQIFYLWQGGLGIFGGLFLAGLSAYYFCQRKKITFINLLDLVLPYVLLGQGLGRLGNYFNSEGFGPKTNLPWGIMINGQRVHPTFFYEALFDLVGFLFLIFLVKKTPKNGILTASYLIIYGLGRFISEYFRIDTFQIGFIKLGYLIALSLFLVGLFLLVRFTTMITTGKKPHQ